MTIPTEDADAVGRRICAVLDPVLVPYGFLAGQVGLDDDDVGVTFCSSAREFSARFSHLVSWMDLTYPVACVDLTADADTRDARLSRVWLEGRSVDDVARELRHRRPGRADGVELPLEQGLERLAATVTALLLGGSPHE